MDCPDGQKMRPGRVAKKAKMKKAKKLKRSDVHVCAQTTHVELLPLPKLLYWVGSGCRT